jgi:hypothetical protein
MMRSAWGQADAEKKRIIEALCRAAGRGEIEEVRRLIAAGTGMAAYGTALHHAAVAGHEGVVSMLLDAGADVGEKDFNYGYTALHFAASNGREGVVRILLDAGAKVAATGRGGDTALHLAGGYGHKGVVTMLLGAGAGAGVFAKNDAGETALDRAGKGGCEGVARVLRDAEAAQAASAPAGVSEVPVGALSAHAGAQTASIAGGREDAERRTKQTLDLAKMQEEKGNVEYKNLSYATAAEAYSKAIRLTEMLKLPLPEKQQALARALKLTCLVQTLRLG